MAVEQTPPVDVPQVDLSCYQNPHPLRNKLGRALWHLVWLFLFRPTPRCCFGWRALLLRCFGARVGTGAHVYASAKIWAPWKLELGAHSCLGADVDCYCVDRIILGDHATVSQYGHLCAAGHDIRDPHMRLLTAPITLERGAWVCARAFIGPGVRIGAGAVVAACAVVVNDVEPWTVVGGNPAKFLKRRELRDG